MANFNQSWHISTWKGTGPFIWRNLNSFHPRMLCAKFGWNWYWSCSNILYNFVILFSLFRYYLPLEKSWALLLNKLEFTSPKNALYQIWLKLDRLILKKIFEILLIYFRYFFIISLWKRMGSFLCTSPKDALYQISWNWTAAQVS